MNIRKVSWFESSESISRGKYPFMDVDYNLWLSEFVFLYNSKKSIIRDWKCGPSVSCPASKEETSLFNKMVLAVKIKDYC